MLSSPIGERQTDAGGGGIWTVCMASSRTLSSSDVRPDAFLSGFIFAIPNISSALFSPTLEKPFMRKSFTLSLLVSAIRFSCPNSMPCGCGAMALGGTIACSTARS